ncbi:pyridoxamine 5'-phosphate oxidase [Candidatus Williamhamiltonella defendens]|uniref:pyridoxamine 5'-phosphate oxidase n=1 Tax=Candidatus Williamhamiltonella defendens TaxID=138072 RepID=UPI00130E56CA|nr:pyridoxamine 5'-phosphate oxidase [Candidatus Hamiltonella defensa]
MSENNKMNNVNIHELRREYKKSVLRRSSLSVCPLDLFKDWLQEACHAGLSDPTAMCLATVDSSGQPFQRMVLLKYYNQEGLVFFTHLNSRKAQHLKKHRNVSLLFPWYMLDRQVIFLGQAEFISTQEAREYFQSRPKESQISTWASPQSEIIATREVLKNRFLEFQKKFQEGEVPLPHFWGGFRVRFHSVEFWQGGPHRLHDRFIYQKKENAWIIDRLSP